MNQLDLEALEGATERAEFRHILRVEEEKWAGLLDPRPTALVVVGFHLCSPPLRRNLRSRLSLLVEDFRVALLHLDGRVCSWLQEEDGGGQRYRCH